MKPASSWPSASCCASGDLAFDVGANLGVIAAMMGAAVGPYGRVVAFEASPRTIAQLHAESQLFQRLQRYHAASSHGRSERRHRAGILWRRVAGGHDHAGRGARPDAQIETIALDDYVERLGAAPRVVKMDIEGAELLALQGFERTLAAHSPALVVEALSNDVRIGEMLQALGYNLCIDAGTLRAHEPRAVTGLLPLQSSLPA